MSAIAKNTKTGNRYSNTRPKVGGGKFCKICKDMGKSMEEYTTHYVRETPDPTSKVVCPVLIAAVCRYCKAGGHTVKHCPKIGEKNRHQAKALKDQSHIISKNYCIEVTKTTTKNKVSRDQNNFAAFAVLNDDDSSDEEEMEVINTPPPSSNVVSYASVLRKVPPPTTNMFAPSQVASLIPVKLAFNDEDVVTLDNITGKWCDEEDIADTIILKTVCTPPTPFSTDHPLNRFVSFIDALAREYTKEFSAPIAITTDAFQQLSKNWEAKFFEFEGNETAMNKVKDTNLRARSIVMTERYIQ
jgi:hypothetical protein